MSRVFHVKKIVTHDGETYRTSVGYDNYNVISFLSKQANC